MRKLLILVAMTLMHQAHASTLHHKPDIPPANNNSSSNIWKSVELDKKIYSRYCMGDWVQDLQNTHGFTRESELITIETPRWPYITYQEITSLIGTYASMPYVLTPQQDPIELFRPIIECEGFTLRGLSFLIEQSNKDGYKSDGRGIVTFESYASYEDSTRGPKVYATIKYSFADRFCETCTVREEPFNMHISYLKKGGNPRIASDWRNAGAKRIFLNREVTGSDVSETSVEANVPYPTFVRFRIDPINSSNLINSPRVFFLRDIKLFTEHCDLEDVFPDDPGNPTNQKCQ